MSPLIITTDWYSLSISTYTDIWSIQGELLSNAPLRTNQLPNTYAILQRYVPSVLSSICFNDAKLPFSKELYNTELGHLLEHVLLEFLCEEKLKNGETHAVFDGRTSWYTDSPENFSIVIAVPDHDLKYLATALPKGLSVFDTLLESRQRSPLSYERELTFHPTNFLAPTLDTEAMRIPAH